MLSNIGTISNMLLSEKEFCTFRLQHVIWRGSVSEHGFDFHGIQIVSLPFDMQHMQVMLSYTLLS